MHAHVLSIGSELILGHLTDTNATFLAQELAAHGIELLYVTQVGDDLDRLTETLRRALAGAELVVCTGGVGPTEDDLTREAIAALVGQEPRVDPELLATIRSFFAARGLTMPDRNAKQAWLIPAAQALPNPIGTAPGWYVRHEGRIIVAMPGVPREMVRMWREQALPRIATALPARSISTVTFKTIGIGESAAEQLLDELVRGRNPVVATYAKDDGVHVRVTAAASSPDAAAALRDETAAEVRSRLGRFVYGVDGTTLPQALLGLLARRGLTLGIAERGSGGRFGSLLAADPSASGLLAGCLSFPGGAREGATALAERAISAFDSRLGLGLAATVQDEGQGIFVGTVEVALTGAIAAAESFPTRAAFEDMQRRAALSAADVLRRALADAS